MKGNISVTSVRPGTEEGTRVFTWAIQGKGLRVSFRRWMLRKAKDGQGWYIHPPSYQFQEGRMAFVEVGGESWKAMQDRLIEMVLAAEPVQPANAVSPELSELAKTVTAALYSGETVFQGTPIRVTGNGLRYWDAPNGDRWLQQNPATGSAYALLAKQGKRVVWHLGPQGADGKRPYLGVSIDGEYKPRR